MRVISSVRRWWGDRTEQPPLTPQQAYRALFTTQQELARATDSKLARRLELRKGLIALHQVNGQLLEVCAQLIQRQGDGSHEALLAKAEGLIAQVRMIRQSLR